MTSYRCKEHQINPVKLADDTVLALSSIKRNGKVSSEFLKKGIQLCEYLISLLEELKDFENQRPQLAFYAIRNDKNILHKHKIDIDEVRKIREEINNLIKDHSSPDIKRIEYIQKFLIDATMPMWQIRNTEYREKNLKRRHIILA